MKHLTTALCLSAIVTSAPRALADLLGDQVEIRIVVPNSGPFDETQTTTVASDDSDALIFNISPEIQFKVDPGPNGFEVTNITSDLGIFMAPGSFFTFSDLDFNPQQVLSAVDYTQNGSFLNAVTGVTDNSATIEITGGGSFSAGGSMTVTLTTEDPPASSYADLCNGDGGDQLGCTDCPCNNNAAIGTVGGCVNSAGTSSRLIATGDSSISLPMGDATDLRFQAEGLPPTAFGVLVSGDAVAPNNMANPCFGMNSGIQSAQFDGLRCVVGQTQRHGGRSANGMGLINDPAGPNRVWGGEAQPDVGLGVQAGFVAGQTRYFQINHRDDPKVGCMRGLNNSQAVEVTFTP